VAESTQGGTSSFLRRHSLQAVTLREHFKVLLDLVVEFSVSRCKVTALAEAVQKTAEHAFIPGFAFARAFQ
jgi:hypothetical protein